MPRCPLLSVHFVTLAPTINHSPQKQAVLLVFGKVQGVCFRAHAAEEAARLGLFGYVRNLPSRDVKALIQGSEEKIHAFIEWAKEGSPSAKVERVAVTWSTLPSAPDSPAVSIAKIYQDFRIY